MEKQITENGIIFIKAGVQTAALHEEIRDQEVRITLEGSFSGEIGNDLLDEFSSLILAGKGICIDAGKATYFAATVGDVFLRTEQKLEKQGKYLNIVNLPKALYEDWKSKGLHELLNVEVKS